MKILVTGGCGFIGSHIVDELQSKRHEVLSIDDLSSGKEERISAVNKRVDITDLSKLKEVVEEFSPEIIVHTAAQVQLRRSIEDPFFDVNTNILGTLNVLSCADGVKKVIYTATGGACYGEPEQLPVKEDDPKNPLSPYGISKYAAELYIQAYANMKGFDYLIFRFGNVYGPRDDPKTKRVIAIFIDALLNDKEFAIFGDGEQTRDFLYVRDIAKMVGQCVDEPTKSHIYNLSSGEGTSVNKIYSTITRLLGITRQAEHKDAIKGEVRHIYLDVTRAKEKLGWEPTPFEKGMEETVEWFKR